MTVSQARMRELALNLPEAEEVQTWGHATFRVADRIFASLPEEGVAMVKATMSTQQELLAVDPNTYAPAPRLGQHGWIHVALDRVPIEELTDLLNQAWSSVAPCALRDHHPGLTDP